MLILVLRTDKPESEIGMFEDDKKLAYEVWPAHRQLAETIHGKLRDMLADQSKRLKDIQGIVMYQGPGSFTGLRIGVSVGNALAASYGIPAVGTTGDEWVKAGVTALLAGTTNRVVLPEYGAPVHITQPRK